MRLTNDDLMHELKLRLSEEKSLKKKYVLKKMLDLTSEL